MRQERTIQATIFEVFAQHEIGCELKAMSQWLDGQRQLTSLVAGDLRRQGVRETGRRGLPAESVLRCALLKQQRQLSYEELAFHLEDSASFRAFARLPTAPASAQRLSVTGDVRARESRPQNITGTSGATTAGDQSAAPSANRALHASRQSLRPAAQSSPAARRSPAPISGTCVSLLCPDARMLAPLDGLSPNTRSSSAGSTLRSPASSLV